MKKHGHIQAIPTKLRGINFRSRLEARWAAFFTLMGWSWSYEPIDLDGYIPDFILHFHDDVLIEVKPYMRLEDASINKAIQKIESSGWDPGKGCWPDRPAIVVGARLFFQEEQFIMSRVFQIYGTEYRVWLGSQAFHSGREFAIIGDCRSCGITIRSEEASYACMRCGKPKASGTIANDDAVLVSDRWKEAGNQVQWMGRNS